MLRLWDFSHFKALARFKAKNIIFKSIITALSLESNTTMLVAWVTLIPYEQIHKITVLSIRTPEEYLLHYSILYFY